MKEDKRAEDGAKYWARSILAKYEAWKLASDTDEPVEIDGEKLSYDDIVDRIHQEPLSMQVRDGWRRPDCKSDGPEEFELLLGTGGPAHRIVGELDDGCEPAKAWLEFQDWFEPWQRYFATDEEAEAILWYAGVFWYGEG